MKLLVWLLVVLATVVVAEQLPDKSHYLVRGLEEIEPAYSEFNGQMYAGRIPFDSSPDRQGKLMFWLFLPDAPTSEDSLVMWLNGGPGCSSFGAGVTFENSPVMVPHRPAGYCCTSPNAKMTFNPFSWTNVAPMLYIEQPGGVGFSEGPEPQVEDDLSRDMHSFLENFFDIFDNLRAKDFYVFGESYAGMYAPSIAHRIHLENKNKNDYKRINLVGLALGNGWIDAKTQGPAVIDYAWWHGMIDAPTKDALHQQFEKCLEGKPSFPLHSFTTPDECGMMEAVLASAGAGLMADRAPNTYDVTTFDTYPMLDFNNPNTTVMKFFNDERVRKALNAPTLGGKEWRGCIPGAGRRRRRLALLDNDRPQSIAPYLAELMDDGHVRVLIYNGDDDLSCNVAGSEMVLNKMTQWSAHDEWMTAPRGMWLDSDDNEMAGWAKEYNRLSLVAVYNSGHLVPFNQPARSQQLFEKFVSNTSFIDVEIPRLFLPEDAITTDADVNRSSIWIVGLVGLVAGIGIGWMTARNNRRTSYAPVQSS